MVHPHTRPRLRKYGAVPPVWHFTKHLYMIRMWRNFFISQNVRQNIFQSNRAKYERLPITKHKMKRAIHVCEWWMKPVYGMHAAWPMAKYGNSTHNILLLMKNITFSIIVITHHQLRIKSKGWNQKASFTTLPICTNTNHIPLWTFPHSSNYIPHHWCFLTVPVWILPDLTNPITTQ
jgi:hypothetical protein